VATTRRLERLAAQVEVRSDAISYKFCAAPKEATRVAVINPHLCEIERKMWVVEDKGGTLIFFFMHCGARSI
jgi:hypothetical protein